MEQEKQTEISFETIIDILLKHLIAILAVSIIAAALGFAYSKYVATPTYKSTTKYSVNVEAIGETYSDYTYAMKVVSGCIEYLNVSDFYNEVAQASGMNMTGAQIGSMLSFNTVSDTNFFTITVATSDANTSKAISDVVADLAPKRINEFKGKNYVMLIQKANLPSSPSSPNVGMNCFICFVIGAFLTYIIFFIKEIADDRVKDVNELSDRYRYPVLGAVPNFSTTSDIGKGGKQQ